MLSELYSIVYFRLCPQPEIHYTVQCIVYCRLGTQPEMHYTVQCISGCVPSQKSSLF